MSDIGNSKSDVSRKVGRPNTSLVKVLEEDTSVKIYAQ